MTKKILENVITRDWSLLFSEDLHFAYTILMRNQLGWSYSENIFVGRDGLVRLYRFKHEYEKDLPMHILKKIQEDHDWFGCQCQNLENQVQQLDARIDELQEGSFDDLKLDTLLEILEEISVRNRDFHPWYNAIIYFPNALSDLQNVDKYTTYVDMALKSRNKVHHIEPRINVLYEALIRAVLRKLDMNSNLYRYVSASELFAKPFAIDEEKLVARAERYLVTNEGVSTLALQDYLKKHLTSFSEDSFVINSRLEGRSACSGVASGPAKIVLSRKMFSKVKDGDILVSPMTTADFVEVIGKVSAIVTDEGGIACHAASLSREFNIPCVVGTRLATKSFKDGDLIFVDANKGIVSKK